MVNAMRMHNHPCIPLRNYVVLWSTAWHGFAKVWSSLFIFPPLNQNWFLTMICRPDLEHVNLLCTNSPCTETLAIISSSLVILVLCWGYSSVGSWAWLLVHGFVYLYSLLHKVIDLDVGKMYIQSCKKTLAKSNCCMWACTYPLSGEKCKELLSCFLALR